ncbi:MAG: ATP-binding protein [Thermodesulfobacteriota bacterium]
MGTIDNELQELKIKNKLSRVFLTMPDEKLYPEVLKIVLASFRSQFGIFGYFDGQGAFIIPAITTTDYWNQCRMADKEIIFEKADFCGAWKNAFTGKKSLYVNNGPFHVPAGHISVDNTMVSPIIFRGKVISAIHVANKSGGYDEEDMRLLASLTDYLAPVLAARLERDRTEKNLKVSEELHRITVENIADPVFITDAEGNFIHVYGNVGQVLGYSAAEIQAMGNISVLAGGNLFDANQLSREKEIRNLDSILLDKNGNSHYFLTNIKQVAIDNGAILFTFHEITDKKMAEEAKAKLERKLRQSQKMEAIGTLAGGIAHDFNNILGVIIGYTDMAREDAPPDSGCARDLEHVLKAGYKAKDLVQQILAFSRQAKVKRFLLQPQPIIKETLKMLRSSIPTTIDIQQDIDPECGAIHADPTQIHQILLNLCTNAYHAMEEQGGILRVELKRTAVNAADFPEYPALKTGAYVELVVRDTGTGIDPASKNRIFDPYFTTKGTGKGTGLGLAIVHGIIRDYGGAIRFRSEPGRGTDFHLFFPALPGQVLPSDEGTEALPAGTERILFVDDEEMIADMGRNMLTRLGYSVTTRVNGFAALETFSNSPDRFDLVITDQTMPGMTGAELAGEMLRLRPAIPIILCTGYSSIISEEKAKAIGIREFLMKPIVKKDIARLIRKVLDG